MHDFKKIGTNVLFVMLAAQSSDYGRELTACEAIDCARTIKLLQEEIASRKKEENSSSLTASIHK